MIIIAYFFYIYPDSVHRGPPGSSVPSDRRPCGAHSGSCRFCHCCHTLTSCGVCSSGGKERKGKEKKKKVNSRIIKKKDKIPQQCAGPHLYAQAAGLALLVHSTLPAGPAEHVGAHFALAVHLLKERTAWAPGSDGLTAHTVALLIRSSAGLWEVSPSSVHRWRWISQKWSHFKEGCNQFRWKAP